ncbi:MAG: endonuclease/exonuclease/phosphatase family protein [Methanoregula sp.]|nr:endonuclease/exonuclease/phosphatase family protein [Methanoregula sp.]
MKFKLGTFNAENLFLRYKFNKNVDPEKFVDGNGRITDMGTSVAFDPITDQQRKNTAQVILANDPDAVCLQEIENITILKQFNKTYLRGKYRYAMLIDANDPRQIDVGILSKYEIAHVRTHMFDKDKKGDIFSRDCLEATVLDKKGAPLLTLFVNHLKSKVGKPEETAAKRLRQVTRVAEIIAERYGSLADDAGFAIAGDFNDTPDSECLKPLMDQPWAENIVTRLPADERWTYSVSKNKNEQIDYLLLSKSLAENNPDAKPVIERRGLRDKVTAYTGPRFPGVGPDGTEASDHCAVFIELDL